MSNRFKAKSSVIYKDNSEKEKKDKILQRKREILQYVDVSDYNYVNNLRENPSFKDDVSIDGDTINFYFDTYGYRQLVSVSNHKITSRGCQCYQFHSKSSCFHMAAVLDKYYEYLLEADINKIMIENSRNIMSLFVNDSDKPSVKKQCYVDIDIKVDYRKTKLNLKVGENKFFIIKSKAKAFFDAFYSNRGSVSFGKNFEYSPNSYYFSDEDKEFIDFAYNVYNLYYSNREFEMNDFMIKQLFRKLEGRVFSINGVKVSNILDFNIGSNLDYHDNSYFLSFDMDFSKIIPICGDYSYIWYNNHVYRLDDRYAKLIRTMCNNSVDSLVFDDKKMFSSSILPIIKNDLELSSNVSDIVVVKKPYVNLYLDLSYSNISLDIKFDYRNHLVSYFDNSDDNIMRDKEYEDSIYYEMIGYGFNEGKNQLIMSDDDSIGYFMDEVIIELSSKYEVFTSEKLKSLSVIKESHVNSSFSIGKDNIMSFDFNLGEIQSSELDNIFDSLKKKKRYYKLKSGNYLDLSDSNIIELEGLCNDMELSSKQISNGSGEISKYKAIYLDSLKNNKYNIIKTDGIFQKFIDNFNKYKDIDITFDKEDEDRLRDYQKVGVKWLYTVYKCGFGGILADEMGLGKSFQTICFIKRVLSENKDSKILIVTPSALCYNWEKEILKFAPNMKYHVFCENRNVRRELITNSDINIYITSYGLLREDIEIYKDIEFECCIIDEAQNIKNSNVGITRAVKSVCSNSRFALTGTPIENSLMELWSIFDFVMPEFLGSERGFHSKYNVKSFEEDDKEKLKNVKRMISPFILRRKKSDVVYDLPDKIENNIYVDLTKEQKELYAGLVTKTKKEMDEIIALEGFQKARFKILELLMRLRQVCIDPSIIYDNYNGGAAKIDEVIRVIEEVIANGHKLLLFSSFRTALDIVKKRLDNENIAYYTIDGSVSSKKRVELVDKFNSDDTKVFLIMLKSGGTGLNLTSATVVIHLDLWWNPQVENQATDRAHRIGQTETVEVIRLITKGTIEERILELQEKKKLLSESVIDGDDMDQKIINQLTEKEIRDLLSNTVE